MKYTRLRAIWELSDQFPEELFSEFTLLAHKNKEYSIWEGFVLGPGREKVLVIDLLGDSDKYYMYFDSLAHDKYEHLIEDSEFNWIGVSDGNNSSECELLHRALDNHSAGVYSISLGLYFQYKQNLNIALGFNRSPRSPETCFSVFLHEFEDAYMRFITDKGLPVLNLYLESLDLELILQNKKPDTKPKLTIRVAHDWRTQHISNDYILTNLLPVMLEGLVDWVIDIDMEVHNNMKEMFDSLRTSGSLYLDYRNLKVFSATSISKYVHLSGEAKEIALQKLEATLSTANMQIKAPTEEESTREELRKEYERKRNLLGKSWE